ncbi:MAG: acetate kinase [Clostridia bacterium]|nr:acetate kinase [Clostridia bacterium]
MKILVINSGSSSLKYQLFDMDSGAVLAKGGCERIGAGGAVTHKVPGRENYTMEVDLPSHDRALEIVFALLTDSEHGVIGSIEEIDAVGHRVAHGGEKYKQSSLVDPELINYLETIVPINPLHGPPAIKGMRACLRLLPKTPQVAVFDTSFYSEMEDFRYIYALPYEFYTEDKIRRYGFHGTSHRYVSQKTAEILGKDIKDLKMITCHLGNGSSITAVDGGVAIDTSMGFTPQEGIPMGTRSGSVDPTIIPYIMKKKGLDPDEMADILNKKSGLLGITGISNDFRNCLAEAQKGNDRAALALKILSNGIKKHIGAYAAEMNGLDVLVFTAGIGENQCEIRRMVCENMNWLGIEIDNEKNENFTRGIPFDISGANARVKVLIVPTDEEYMIALDTQRLVK